MKSLSPTALAFCVMSSFLAMACGNSDDVASASDAGSSDAPATSTGSIGSQTIDVVDSLFYSTPQDSGAKLKIKVTSYAGACSVETSGNDKENSARLNIQLETDTGAITPGTYTVASDVVEVKYDAEDATCSSDSATGKATDGTVTITAISATEVSGSFALSFGADSVSGTFAALQCDEGTAVGACVP